MHVVIGGYGRVGRYLAHELERQGHTVAVIDRNAEVFEEFEGINGLRLTGEVFDRDTLIKAGIERADAFAACTSGDNSNIVAARVARERFDVPLVVARIFDPKRAVDLRALRHPDRLGGAVVELAAARDAPRPRRAERLRVRPGRGRHPRRPRSTQALAGKRVLDIELPRVLSIVAVERDGKAIMLADIDVVHARRPALPRSRPCLCPELPKLLGRRVGGRRAYRHRRSRQVRPLPRAGTPPAARGHPHRDRASTAPRSSRR